MENRDALAYRRELEWIKEAPTTTGIFLDLDGTLVPIVDDPDAVELSQETRTYVEGLASLYRAVVLISGRAASTLVRILNLPTFDYVGNLAYVGNHGLEIIHGGEREVLLPEDLARTMKGMEEALRHGVSCEGALLELKELSHAIHYRRASDPVAARACILEALGKLDLSGVRITEGKRLVQIRPESPLDKGTALELLVRRGGLQRVLYAGDDTTDLDAFRAVAEARTRGHLQGVLIGVRYDDTPKALLEQADFTVDGIAGMRRLLEWLSVSY